MKRFLLTLFLLGGVIAAQAQPVTFTVSDGLSNQSLREKIEKNLSTLLTSFNDSYHDEADLDLSWVSIAPDAKDALDMLWANMPFHCEEEEIVERILTTYSGYQVRNVPIELKADGGNNDYQELVIDMEKDGTVSRVNLALQSHLYRKVISDGSEVTDLRCRQMILDYVEQFRTAYNRKDIDFLDNVFSDDALIITGKVVRRKPGDRTAVLKETPDIVYTQQRKHEYIEKLRTKVFPAAKYIQVTFTDIKVSKHPSVDGYYGVMLRQGYKSSNYSDDGYLFMIWDFRDESHPQIHVRTWQPYWLDDGKTQRLGEDKVFNINSFTIR
ncbi:MAG: nuclear transport factor 2 family protein [Bacteroidales bacterium]|nr:nuclear transport factor 2 family protein [Bacteroidales bacterium]